MQPGSTLPPDINAELRSRIAQAMAVMADEKNVTIAPEHADEFAAGIIRQFGPEVIYGMLKREQHAMEAAGATINAAIDILAAGQLITLMREIVGLTPLSEAELTERIIVWERSRPANEAASTRLVWPQAAEVMRAFERAGMSAAMAKNVKAPLRTYVSDLLACEYAGERHHAASGDQAYPFLHGLARAAGVFG